MTTTALYTFKFYDGLIVHIKNFKDILHLSMQTVSMKTLICGLI